MPNRCPSSHTDVINPMLVKWKNIVHWGVKTYIGIPLRVVRMIRAKVIVIPGHSIANQNPVGLFLWNWVIPLHVDAGGACAAVCHNYWTDRGNYVVSKNDNTLKHLERKPRQPWLVFMPVVPEENPRSKARTNNKRNPHMTPGRKRTRDTLVGGENSHHCTIPAPNDNMGSGWFLDLLATLCRKPLWSIILSDLFHNSKFYWRNPCKLHAVCYRWNNLTLVQYPCLLLVLRLTVIKQSLFNKEATVHTTVLVPQRLFLTPHRGRAEHWASMRSSPFTTKRTNFSHLFLTGQIFI